MAVPGLVYRLSTAMEGTLTSTQPFTLCVQATLGGNAAVIFLQTSGAGVGPTITDDKGNTWVNVVGPVLGNQHVWCFLATNIAAGTTLITVTMTTYDNFVTIDYSEWFNVSQAAPATALDTSASAPGVGGSNVTTASITPIAGSVVIHYVTGDSGTLNTGFTKGTGWTLLSANLMPGASLVTTAVQYQIAPGGAFTPSMILVGGGATSSDTIVIALKAAAAGTAPPAGIRVAGVQKSSFGPPTGPTGVQTLVFQFPHVGNLMVMTSTHDFAISTLTDGDVNTWDHTQFFGPGGVTQTQTSFAENVTPNTDMTGPTIHWASPMGGVDLGFVTIYDIVGADSSPWTGQYVKNNGTQSVNANLDILTLTPTAAGNLFIIDSLITSHTVDKMVAPTVANGGVGILFDFPDANGGGTTAEDDDFHGYWYTPSTTPATITLGIQNNAGPPTGVGAWTATGMEFKPAATGPIGIPIWLYKV